MRAPRRAASTAAAVLLVALPATAAPTVGQGATRSDQLAAPGVVPAGPLAAAIPEPVGHPVQSTPAPASEGTALATGAAPGAGTVALGAPATAFAGEVVDGIPVAALRAYQAAAATVTAQDPSCGLDWALLAGIGRVESDHGRYGGSIPDAAGVVQPAILGPVLSGGPGMARISDTDGGRLDGNTTHDRAVGPMQFIPSTWAMSGADGDGDGVANPQDLDDAALAAANYLCAGNGEVRSMAGAQAALLRYNHSTEYGMRVLWLASAYRTGSSIVALPTPRPTVPVSPIGGLTGGTGIVRAEAPRTPSARPGTVVAAPQEPASETVRPTATPTWTPRDTPKPSPTSSSPMTSPTTTPTSTTTSPSSTPTSTTTSPSSTPTSTTTSPSSTPTSTTTSPSSTPTSTTTSPSSTTTSTTTSPSSTPTSTTTTPSSSPASTTTIPTSSSTTPTSDPTSSTTSRKSKPTSSTTKPTSEPTSSTSSSTSRSRTASPSDEPTTPESQTETHSASTRKTATETKSPSTKKTPTDEPTTCPTDAPESTSDATSPAQTSAKSDGDAKERAGSATKDETSADDKTCTEKP